MAEDCGGLVAGLSVFFYLLGVATATLVLVLLPSIHRRLISLFDRCCRRNTPSTAVDNGAIKPQGNNYAEIDPNLTRTWMRSPEHNKKVVVDLRPLNNPGSAEEARYSYAREPKAYENVAMKQEALKRFSCHTYCIVEPGGSKRLPVRLIDTLKPEAVSSDPQHVYFVLEPGSNKVTPVNVSEDRGTLQTSPDHIYFVLEPGHVQETEEAEPYAVNDLNEDHAYFILEKQGN
ncbi:hypothetical protein MAR_010688 [Mya arenaria]|uniref:Uncharacterized protein n=1 Tax=Mya arenaria TaxID=6604 RepID=A0ABY7FUZ5_MYAAR|nr:uncharacterized protein LOC128216419 [Mya arenaria]XP_052778941.1 uncharacterized protein LOC128216419 [Mya arenaria]WAR24984.1 hypothetical protein MAR_010688 [Mya arenaria]